MNIPFVKAHGTGNDFIIFIKEECPNIVTDPEFIKNICSRRTGIGADGVIILSDEKDYVFRMEYYNCDGSWETFCANGARCSAMLMMKKLLTKSEIKFLAGDGEHTAKIKEDVVSLKMKQPEYEKESIEVEGINGCIVDSGARHFVTEVNNFTPDQVEKIAPEIRYSEIILPKGVNVNFFEYIDEHTLKIWTYEKGIEKLMLSCGSGSTAVVFHAAKTCELTNPVTCIELGGNLTISFNDDWKYVWLTGKAVLLFESEIDTDNL